ncbi:MAG: hypothetical protein IAF38_00020, partial [Bacteroidia bacterium]|nr:hypothetical protein [Bacteroidia bacterium]
YDKEVISAHKSDEYKETFFQSLNLGVFGADLGYVSMYNLGAEQLKYLSQAQKLSDALGISNAFDTQTMKRINDNIKIKDSLLVLVSVAYKSSDAFLKKNQRNEVSSLILIGGWIESLNFAAQVNKTKGNEELKMRIAYQKQAINSIVELLKKFEKFKEQSEFAALRDNLTGLQKTYDEIKFTYVYEKPETDALNKVTTLNSRTDVSVTDAQITQITEKVKALREWCINGEKSK